MRTFVYIDVAVQSFILGLMAILGVVTIIEGSIESIGMIALYGAFFLGPWQMLSSVITCSIRGMFLKLRLIHLVTSTVYLIAAGLIVAYGSKAELNDFIEQLGIVLGYGIPAGLAVFYYNITVRSVRIIHANSRAKIAA